MTDSTRTDEPRTDHEPRADQTGGARPEHAANARVAQIRGGLEKVVTGREAMIKTQARGLAERLDARTQGRHHQKIRIALMAVEFVVDRVGTPDPDATAPRAAGRGDRAEEPEDLGEFHRVDDR